MWGWWLADSAYIGLRNVLCKFKQYRNFVMRMWMFVVNAIIDHYRARVEHAVKEVKHPAMFQSECILVVVVCVAIAISITYCFLCYY